MKWKEGRKNYKRLSLNWRSLVKLLKPKAKKLNKKKKDKKNYWALFRIFEIRKPIDLKKWTKCEEKWIDLKFRYQRSKENGAGRKPSSKSSLHKKLPS